MATHDPRVVRGALEDVSDQLQLWSQAARDAQAQASLQQLHSQERVDQCMRAAQMAAEVFVQCEQSLRANTERAKASVGRCTQALDLARNTLNSARQAATAARATLTRWNDELARSQRQLQHAQDAFDQARRRLAAAEAELASAQRDLSWARSRLSACERDDSREDCRSERSAVWAAETRVSRAEAEISTAQQQMQVAWNEVALARTRVEGCRKAVTLANRAVVQSGQAGQMAAEAAMEAESGLGLAQSALSAANRNLTRLESGRQLLDVINQGAEQVGSHVETAEGALVQSDEAEMAAQDICSSAHTELAQRIEDLRLVDEPSGSIMAAVAMGGAFMAGAALVGRIGRSQKGEIGEQKVMEAIKLRFHFDFVGRGLQYSGIRGNDIYAYRKRPDGGYDLDFFEAKTTADASASGSVSDFRQRLKCDAEGYIQGSPAYAENRLQKAHSHGSLVASYLAGRSGPRHSRYYVALWNMRADEVTFAQAFSKKRGSGISLRLLSKR